MAVPPYVTAGFGIEEAWGDQIADSVVNPFASTAARSAAITAPTSGMTTALTIADATNGLYVYNGVNWRLPWAMPWGPVIAAAGGTGSRGAAVTTTNSSGSTTAPISWTGLTVTWTAIANRIYRTTVYANVTSDNASGSDYAELVIANNGGTALAAARCVVQSGVLEGRAVSYVDIGLSGSNVRKVMINRFSGAGSVTGQASATKQASIVVEDIGPSGAPA